MIKSIGTASSSSTPSTPTSSNKSVLKALNLKDQMNKSGIKEHTEKPQPTNPKKLKVKFDF